VQPLVWQYGRLTEEAVLDRRRIRRMELDRPAKVVAEVRVIIRMGP
jgi:hypothetical protein